MGEEGHFIRLCSHRQPSSSLCTFVVQTFVPSPVCQYPFEDGDPIQGQHIQGAVSRKKHTADSKFQEWNTGNIVCRSD